MNWLGQNQEDKFILEYFGKDFKGTLLSIGENDGLCLSNTFNLISLGWKALLIEPAPTVFNALKKRHQWNENVYCWKVAVGTKNERMPFYESGQLLGKGDKALVSTIKKSEVERWGSANIKFNEIEAEVITFAKVVDVSPFKKFDFISLDAEGMDWEILEQMNLKKLNCSCICLEHNSIINRKNNMIWYCKKHGLTKVIADNAENIIMAK